MTSKTARIWPDSGKVANPLTRMRSIAGACLTASLLTACGISEDTVPTDASSAAKSVASADTGRLDVAGENYSGSTGDPKDAGTASDMSANGSTTPTPAPTEGGSAATPNAAAPVAAPTASSNPSPAPAPVASPAPSTGGSNAATPTPTPAPSPAPAAGSTVNSLDTIVNDMKLMNDLALAGVNGSYGWATGPGHVIMGNDPRGTHTPSWFNVSNTYYKSAAYWNAIIPWVVVFDGVGNAASNTRVQMRNMKLYMKRKSTGSWALVSSTQGVDGSLYPKSLSGSDVSNPNSRTETDGSTSVLPPGGNLVYHGWGNLTNLSGSDVAAIFVTLQARLVLNNTSGNDDRSAAKYLIHVGGDYYPETSTRVSDMAPAYYFPGIGVSRAKLVSSQWQAFNFSTIDVGVEDPGGGTISEAELRSNPPPLE